MRGPLARTVLALARRRAPRSSPAARPQRDRAARGASPAPPPCCSATAASSSRSTAAVAWSARGPRRAQPHARSSASTTSTSAHGRPSQGVRDEELLALAHRPRRATSSTSARSSRSTCAPPPRAPRAPSPTSSYRPCRAHFDDARLVKLACAPALSKNSGAPERHVRDRRDRLHEGSGSARFRESTLSREPGAGQRHRESGARKRAVWRRARRGDQKIFLAAPPA